MATTDKIISASSAADLVAAANAYLATLVNPTVKSWSVQAADLASRPGIEWKLLLTTEDGGAALLTPFLLDILEYQTVPGLQDALDAYRVAYAAEFVSGPRFLQIADDTVTSSKLAVAFIRNTTAGASANYLYAN